MAIEVKVAIILTMYLVIPAIVALLYMETRRNNFLTGFLYSFVSMLMMPIAMEALGSREFSEFLSDGHSSVESGIVAIFRIIAFAVIFCLGGASFISRVYKMVTGQEWEEEKKALSNEIKEAKTQSEQIALAVVSGEIGRAAKSKDDVDEIIRIISNSPPPTPTSAIPQDLRPLLNELISIGAIKSSVDENSFQSILTVSDIGKSIYNK